MRILSPTGVQVLPYLACSKNDVEILLEKAGFSRKEGEKISLYLTRKHSGFSLPKEGKCKKWQHKKLSVFPGFMAYLKCMFMQPFQSGKGGVWLVKLKPGKPQLVSQKIQAAVLLCPHISVGRGTSQ